MTNYTKFAIKGATTVLILSAIGAFLGYLVRLVLARNLSVEEYGLFYSVFAFLGLLRYLNKINCLSSVTGARIDNSGGIIYKIN